MQQQGFYIRIGELVYAMDETKETFQLTGKTTAAQCRVIPMSKLRSKEGNWYILWDKQAHGYYHHDGNKQAIPLSVEWLKIVVDSDDTASRERIDTLIILAETMQLLRTGATEGSLKKSELQLRKSLQQFLNRTA